MLIQSVHRKVDSFSALEQLFPDQVDLTRTNINYPTSLLAKLFNQSNSESCEKDNSVTLLFISSEKINNYCMLYFTIFIWSLYFARMFSLILTLQVPQSVFLRFIFLMHRRTLFHMCIMQHLCTNFTVLTQITNIF